MTTTTLCPGGIRIDELAQRSGVASGTIRFYQREGLIPAPSREGRVAYYGTEHAELLERIRALQEKGLPLALIRDLLERERRGQDVAGWLALDQAVFSEAGSVDAAREQLAAGLIEAGVPQDAINAGSGSVEEGLRSVAELMADLGWLIFEPERAALEADRASPELAGEVLAKLERLRELANRVVGTLFAEMLDEAIRERSERLAADLSRRR